MPRPLPGGRRHSERCPKHLRGARDAGRRRHEGIDIFAPRGTRWSRPPTGGYGADIESAGRQRRLGMVASTRLALYYAHLDRQAVSPGERVRAGDVIGYAAIPGMPEVPSASSALRSLRARGRSGRPSAVRVRCAVRGTSYAALASGEFWIMTIRNVTALAVLLVLGVATASNAQYFGRNKVQYEKFDFKVLTTEHFDIYYYPEEEAAVQLAVHGGTLVRASSKLDAPRAQRTAAARALRRPPALPANNTLSGEVGEGQWCHRNVQTPHRAAFAGGLAENGSRPRPELVHAFQFDMATGLISRGIPSTRRHGTAAVVIEGMAEYSRLVRRCQHRDVGPRGVLPGQEPSVDDLDDPDFFPYRYGTRSGRMSPAGGATPRWRNAARHGAAGRFEAAMETVLGVDKRRSQPSGTNATRRTYAPFFETTRKADAFARALITGAAAAAT